ncbi:hypothetical protein CHS0354_016972 [Potamilus streckersoni]|uniref:protein-tyrosine-phosphatase n=1 Tax=Potamilus streckersoni TaxID=2493646 RepID=A0AAE0VGT4_9BIVA|nr:hypothetical protein CHS0354_016972 [Potamilus streckersoni]
MELFSSSKFNQYTKNADANYKKGDIIDLLRRCPDGSFGYKCRYRCRCHRDDVCGKVSGECQSGCTNGYWGPGCQLSNSCFYNGQPRLYQGTLSVTANLYICQSWGSQTPHRHSYDDKDFPDEKLPDNYCRTTKDSSRPWCYTTEKDKRWEHCNVNNCNCPAGRFGHNCIKECHCQDSNEACHSIMGICETGCAPGWTGFDCQTAVRCPSNRYGWDCTQRCYCHDMRHCDRFTGPTSDCVCQDGYFNPPFCEPVTRPRIISFGNEKVNPGSLAIFNCTVAGFPTPKEYEIRLVAPQDKRVTLIKSVLIEFFLYTRSSLFQVSSVYKDEKYSCVVRATAGDASLTTLSSVYERPVLISAPKVVEEFVTGTEIPLEWPSWDRAKGDTGDSPILWYSVWARTNSDVVFRTYGVVTQIACSATCNHTLTNLIPNTEYAIYITVRREADTVDGLPGPIIYVRTKCSDPSKSAEITSVVGELQYNKTYPKTRLILKWQDPDKSTWNCDSIQRYQILISSGEPELLVTHLAGDTEKQISIPKLEPATRYCIKIRFQNNQGYFSPESQERCTVSPATIPSAPTKLTLRIRGNRFLTLSWERPEDPRGNISIYTIIYWQGFLAEVSTKKGVEYHSEEQMVEYTLIGLEPYTKYHIQVQALNAAGPGEYSDILTTMTDEDVPGAVSSFRNITRTHTSITFQWRIPNHPNGEILFYTLSCLESQTNLRQPAGKDAIENRIPSNVFEYVVTGLVSGVPYHCTINATTAKGEGPREALAVWTLPAEPVDPPAPTILQVTESTVTIQLKPVDDKSISFYRIIVEILPESKRVRHSLPDPILNTLSDFYTAEKEGGNAYVAAQLDKDIAKGEFIVGDNGTYSGFYNAPLRTDQSYGIWFGAFSEVDGIVRQSFSRAERAFVARSVITAAPPTNHVPVIIGVIIVFIILILVFAMLLFIWRKRHLQAEREKAEMPNFGPTIIPEPDPTPPSTPIESFESEPLIEASTASDGESEPIYANIGYTVLPVKVEDLWDYVKNNKVNDAEGFRKEFKLIPAGITAHCDFAKKLVNKQKNRYGNIVAYDHSRVVLTVDRADENDDYINANYIDGYNKSKTYIAAQGPTTPTLKDIWRMVWQENSKTILMLTNPTETGKNKCEQYWPNEDAEIYGSIRVELMDTFVLPDFTVRTFQLTKDQESRLVKQYHYTTWPDHGVPKYSASLLLLRQKVRAHDQLDSGPPIIHCSAGVGRTGTYIAIDVQLEQAKTEGIVDVHNFVQLMRTQRINMVQTLDQYIFIYVCLLEALLSGDTTIRVDDFPDTLSEMCQFDPSTGKTKLEEQFDILRLITTTMDRDETTTALRPENIFKNRSREVIPANRSRPYLMTPVEGYNDYINAVFINSYLRRDAFIITQTPLPNTVVDFWRLIYDHNSYCIVMLNEIDPNDETCEQYWTLETCGEKFGPFIVETTAEIKSDPSITVRDFTVTNVDIPHEAPRVVRQFHFHRWMDGASVPNSKLALLELFELVENWQKHTGNHPVTVHCMNGVNRCGLYIGVSCILEAMRLEKEVDVFHTIKQIRVSRSQLIVNLEQFRFCHEIILDYIQTMGTMTTFS